MKNDRRITDNPFEKEPKSDDLRIKIMESIFSEIKKHHGISIASVNVDINYLDKDEKKNISIGIDFGD